MSDSVLDEMRERLLDDSYRRDYGAANARYELALALVKARRKAGLTQKLLAELVGVSQAYIAKLESGEANPTIGNIGAMLAVMWLRPSIQPVSLLGYAAQPTSLAPHERSHVSTSLADLTFYDWSRGTGTASDHWQEPVRKRFPIAAQVEAVS